MKHILTLCAVALCVSCSDSHTDTPITSREVPIALKPAYAAAPVKSRAPHESISATTPMEVRVLAATTTANYSAPHANGKMIFKDTGTTAYDPATVSEEEAHFPEGDINAPLYFSALFPYNGWTVEADGKSATYTISGKDDVIAAAEISATPADVQDGSVPTLVLHHLLTKLEIKLLSADAHAPTHWGHIKEIRLSKVKGQAPLNRVSVNLHTGVAQYALPGQLICYGMHRTANNVPVYTDTPYTSQQLPVDATTVAYVLIAPLDSGTDADLTFEFLTDYKDTPISVDVKLPYTGNTAGGAFDLTFTFEGGSLHIVPEATIEPWGDEENNDITLT